MINQPYYIPLKVLQDNLTTNFQSLVKDYRELTWAQERIHYSLFESRYQPKPWQEQLELLSTRFTFLNYSLCQLVEGTEVSNIRDRKDKKKVIDITGIYLLIRAVIETYLTIYYLNFESKDDEQNSFRNNLYKFSGLSRRQEFQVFGDEGKKKLQDEKVTIEQLKINILENAYFKSLPSDKRKQLLNKKEAREYSWFDLIKSRGIVSMNFLTLWKLLSNHAHAEYIGTMQLNSYVTNPKDTLPGIYNFVSQPLMLVTLYIDDLITHFTAPRLVYNTLEQDLRTKIELFQRIIKSKDTIEQIIKKDGLKL